MTKMLPLLVIARAAQQSRAAKNALDCFGMRPRNDERWGLGEST
jgi:hypothetical protein